MRIQEKSHCKYNLIPKPSNMALNTDSSSSSKSDMYTNFQKCKTNHNIYKKSQLMEINLASLNNLTYKTERIENNLTDNRSCFKGVYHIIERIFKYIKPKISTDLYIDLKFFLSEELKNLDENGDLTEGIHSNLQNSFNSVTEIINMNITNSRNFKRIEIFNSNKNLFPKQMKIDIRTKAESDRIGIFYNYLDVKKEKSVKFSPKIKNSKAIVNKDINNKKIVKLGNEPVCGTNNDIGTKLKYEIKTSLYNEFRAISNTKSKNNSNTNLKSCAHKNTINSKKILAKSNPLNASDVKSINNNSNNTNSNKIKGGKIILGIPHEISPKEIANELKVKQNSKTSYNNSVTKNTNSNSDQTVSNNSQMVNLFNRNNNNEKNHNKDLLKEVKLNLDENLRPLLNFSYENFFNKEHNDSYSIKESFNDLNLDNPSLERKKTES